MWSPGVIRGCGGPEVEGLQVRAGSVGVGCSFTALLVDIYLGQCWGATTIGNVIR